MVDGGMTPRVDPDDPNNRDQWFWDGEGSVAMFTEDGVQAGPVADVGAMNEDARVDTNTGVLNSLGRGLSNAWSWTTRQAPGLSNWWQGLWNDEAQEEALEVPSSNGKGVAPESIAQAVEALMNDPSRTYDVWSGGEIVAQLPYLNGSSCNNTVRQACSDTGIDTVNDVFGWRGEAGNTFDNVQEKIDWFGDNPDLGTFLGGYVFNGHENLEQIVATGNELIDGNTGYALPLLQPYLDEGHTVISWTPDYNALPEDIQAQVGRVALLNETTGQPLRDALGNQVFQGYSSRHIAFVGSATNNNLLTRGPLLIQGGLTPDHWANRFNFNAQGLYDQHWTTGSAPESKRPFYLFALYQGQ